MPIFGDNLGMHNFVLRIRKALIDHNSNIDMVAAQLGFEPDSVRRHINRNIKAFCDLYPTQQVGRSPYSECLKAIETLVISDALETCNFSYSATAKLLGIGRTTLMGKCKILGIKKPSPIYKAANGDRIESRA